MYKDPCIRAVDERILSAVALVQFVSCVGNDISYLRWIQVRLALTTRVTLFFLK